MSNEELDRKMEFIIEQQAQFSADIEVMREVHAADTKLLKEETKLLKEETKLVKEETRMMKEQIQSLNSAVTAVVGMVGKLSEAQERTSATIAGLAAAQERTEERLNIFIGVVERHLGGNGSNGPANPS